MRIDYSADFKSWRRKFKEGGILGTGDHFLWTKCCVCKTVTLATFPRWKRLRIVKAKKPYGEFITCFYTPFIHLAFEYNVYWGMCSDECLNFFYLGNDTEGSV
jgi:hypothetical protein